jgi:tRNA(Ile)-lysidine synthase
MLFNRWPQLTESVPAIPVTISGQIELSGGWKLSCERWHLPALAREQSARNDDQFQVWLDADAMPKSLELRVRRAGDRIEPLGMEGHSQKISDFFINEKIPQRARACWPLLCSDDVVVWVPGYRPAHPFRLTAGTRNVLYFAFSLPARTP